MYLPAHFVETRTGTLHALMRAAPLATLVVVTDGLPEVNHVPLLLDAGRGAHGTLRGHVARANPLWQHAVAGVAALAVFHGPEAYVSPSFYASKRETGKVVPTWNYAVVHAHGRLRAIDDVTWVRRLVEDLTNAHEATRAAPWAVADAPPSFTDAQLRAIVGIEIDVERLVGKFKLSQNRSAADRGGVVAGLGASQRARDVALAALMRGDGSG